MTKTEIEILEQQSPATLAQWWAKLNAWDWVDELGEPESQRDHEKGRRTALMSWIENEIGFKECLRAWNAKRMTDKQFEEFWNKGLGKRHRKEDAILDANELE